MKVLLLVVALLILVFPSCKTGSLFRKKSPHEQYGQKLIKAGLKETALGVQWFTAAEQALSNPQTITIPYKEVGYFPADKPRAVGLKFTAKRGEKLLFQLDKNPSSGFIIYAELWQIKGNEKPFLVLSMDTADRSFDYEVKEENIFLLRLQPELLRSGEYAFAVSIGPSLNFPVAGKTARIGSFWGDSRDKGGRRHEGIDIFAPEGTPAIAAAGGFVFSVTENNLGGKVVFMRLLEKNITLYYAHLGRQLVSRGQRVRVGDTLGTIDNTGNAKYTPSHLHFGIYASGGATDPFPFVNPKVLKPADVSIDLEELYKPRRLKYSA